MEDKPLVLEDDTTEPILPLIQHRLPWLLIGLLGGIIITIISSSFEDLLSKNISLVFFIPVIVYMAGAVATQTETIYIRNLARKGKDKFTSYLVKEVLTGIALGLIFGLILGGFAYIWFNSQQTALTVGLSMFATISVSPLVALLVAAILAKEKTDPALGAGPFTTVLEDLISLMIYFLIASVVMFR